MKLALYGYWRSSSTWRVRIALALKGIAWENRAVNLLEQAQWKPEHIERNATGQVPVLAVTGDDGTTRFLGQSLAIIEFLEEAYPATPRLLPADPFLRARARQLAENVNSGIQPFQNLQVLKRVGELGADGPTWARGFIARGLEALEKQTRDTAGAWAVGNEPTIADCCIVPQLGGARRFDVDVREYPTLLRIEESASAHPAFQAAHPDRQPDAPANQGKQS